MALVDTTWYANSVAYAAVTPFAISTAYTVGQIRRQLTTPAVGSERCFIVIVAGTSAASEPTWVLTRGAKTISNTVTFMECTGQAALNGDLTNTQTWAAVKAATPAVLGQIIKRSSGASYQICTTAGAMSASEPAFSDTAGVTTTDTTAVWTSLGAVGSYTGGMAPFARLFSAMASTWFVAGSTVYVSSNHAETQGTAMSLALLGSTTVTGRALCHNVAGSYPPTSADLTTGASVAVTGNVTLTISYTASGGFYFYGIKFSAGNAASLANISMTANNGWYRFERCSFELATTSATPIIEIGHASFAGGFVFDNTTMKFGNVAQKVSVLHVHLLWQNTGQVLVSGSSIPTGFIWLTGTNGAINVVVLEALDLSQLTGAILAETPGGISHASQCMIRDCKLHASGVINSPNHSNSVFQSTRSGSGTASYASSRYAYEGTETTETTIVRTGGSVDPSGQAQSRKIVTTATAQWLRPFRCEPYAIWNETVGADVTVTIYGTASSSFLNDDVWLEVEYQGSASNTLGTIATTTKASVLATGASLTSDSSTWGGGTTPFKLVAVLNSPQPGLAGLIHARVKVGKASATLYLDPKVELT